MDASTASNNTKDLHSGQAAPAIPRADPQDPPADPLSPSSPEPAPAEPMGPQPPQSPRYSSASPPPGQQPRGRPSTTRRHSSRHRPSPQPNTGFIITERIGKGSFATVYKGEWGGDLLAVGLADATDPPTSPASMPDSTRTPDATAPRDSTTPRDSTRPPDAAEPAGSGRMIEDDRPARRPEDRQTVAIKVVQRSHLKKEKRLMGIFEAEMAILKKMTHPHVVHLIDVVKTPTDFNLIMEYCSMGDLSNFIRKKQHLIRHNPAVAEVYAKYPANHSGLHPHLVRHFLAQLACSLAFLRQHDIVHRDVKPQNLLLRPGAASPEEARAHHYAGSWDLPVVKIADFGFARFLPATSMAETLCGSPLYMAPEILNYEKYNAKADLWSVGAVAYEMATGKPPFPAVNHLELIRKIDGGKDRIAFPFPVDGDLQELIRGLLRRKPEDRLTFDDFFRRTAWSENVGSATPAVMSASALGPAGSPASLAGDAPPLINNPALGTTTPTASESQPFGNTPPFSNARPLGNAHSLSNAPVSNEPPLGDLPSSSPANPARTDAASDASDSSSDPTSYSQYLRRQGANDIAVASPSPSPESSQFNSSGIATETPAKKSASPRRRSRGGTEAGEHYRRPDRGEGRQGDSETEYVFIEKRMVEVNALADDLQAPPGVPQRRLTNPDQQPRRRRLSSIAYGASPTNALAQALLKSSARLFGARADPTPATSVSSSSGGGGAGAGQPSPFSAIATSPQTGEKQVIDQLEQLATIGKVVSLYAEVKYIQLDLAEAGDEPGDGSDSRFMDHSMHPSPSPSPGSHIDPYFQMTLANESLVLHLKALSVLAKAMSLAAEWWEQHQRGVDVPAPSPGINTLVQWIRDKFNECVVRAERERNLVKLLSAETDSSPPETTAERLLFDRALEMAKAAAVQEMSASEPSGAFTEAISTCEMNYGTAVWMLRSLLIVENDSEELSDDDRTMVETLMAKIAQRLVSLRRKLASSSQSSSSSTSDRWRRKSGSPGSQKSMNFSRRTSLGQLTPP